MSDEANRLRYAMMTSTPTQPPELPPTQPPAGTPRTDAALLAVHRENLPEALHVRACAEALQRLAWDLERELAAAIRELDEARAAQPLPLWKEEARLYASNADYWHDRAQRAEAEVARLRDEAHPASHHTDDTAPIT